MGRRRIRCKKCGKTPLWAKKMCYKCYSRDYYVTNLMSDKRKKELKETEESKMREAELDWDNPKNRLIIYDGDGGWICLPGIKS